jgi:hypothetical protein
MSAPDMLFFIMVIYMGELQFLIDKKKYSFRNGFKSLPLILMIEFLKSYNDQKGGVNDDVVGIVVF